MALTVNEIVAPAVEPLTLAEVKSHLRVDITDDDALITSLITAARQWVERGINRALITRTNRATFDLPMTTQAMGGTSGMVGNAPRLAFDLPYATPGNLATVSTVELETDVAVWQTLSTNPQTYAVDLDNSPCRVWLRASSLYLWLPQWDWVGFGSPRIRITYTCGYGATGASVPQAILLAIKQTVGHLYENRESGGALPDSLLPDKYMVWSL